MVRTRPGLERATAIFRSLPPRERASILRPRAENPRSSAERRTATLRTARNLEKLADWQERQAEARRPWLARVLDAAVKVTDYP